VLFHDAARAAQVVLEAARSGVERIAHRNIDILVGMVLGRVALHDDLAFRYHEMHGHVIKPALAMVPMVLLDDDMAAGDPRVKELQRLDVLANPRLDSGGCRHVTKGDTKRYLHGNDPR